MSRPKGEIWFVELDKDGNPGQPGRALTREYHLSYPLVFQYKGEIYLLPETSQNRSVEIYCAIEFLRRWESARVLLTNVPAVGFSPLELAGRI